MWGLIGGFTVRLRKTSNKTPLKPPAAGRNLIGTCAVGGLIGAFSVIGLRPFDDDYDVRRLMETLICRETATVS